VVGDSVPVVVSVFHPYYVSHRVKGKADRFHQTLFDTLFYLKKNDPGRTLTLQTSLSNGKIIEESVRFRFVGENPKIEIRLAVPAWEENERKAFIVYRCDERTLTRLTWTEPGREPQFFTFDRLTRNGEFLVSVERPGEYRCQIRAESAGNEIARSPEISLNAETGFIPIARPDTLAGRLPMGLPLNRAFDFDGDGRREIVMTRLDERLSPGGVDFWEFNDSGFVFADSIRIGTVLVKDAADFDGDGQTDLLGNVSDRIFVFSGSPYPTRLKYDWPRTGLFPARWVDLDGAPPLELIAKDTTHYWVCRWRNERYEPTDIIPDTTSDYFVSTAPNALFGDFNADGRPEIAFMDGDGDIFVYQLSSEGVWKPRLTFSDSVHAESSDYFVAGDFDGDGRQEFFSAVRPPLLRNEADFEYRPRYWRLRVYEPDSLRVLWQDFLYNVNSPNWNAAVVGDLDGKPGEEIVFSSFPRTYVVHGRGGYRMSGFLYGGLNLRHAIADWDADGKNELAAGRGDSIFLLRFSPKNDTISRFWISARSKTTCGDSLWVAIEWERTEADFYVVYEGEYDEQGNPPETLTFFAQSSEPRLSRLRSPARVVYLVEAYKNGGPIRQSYFAEVWVRPSHVYAFPLSKNELSLRFDAPIFPQDYHADMFSVNGKKALSAVVSRDSTLLLTFEDDFREGTNRLDLRRFRDGFGNEACDSLTFFFSVEPQKAFLWPVRWDVYDEKNAWIEFNAPLEGVNVENFSLFPVGETRSVALETEHRVRVTIATARFGPTGEGLWMRLRGLRSRDGRTQRSPDGEAVHFGARGNWSSPVFVYPNPVRQGRFEGCRFAGLPFGATVAIFTVTGIPVTTLKESEGWGGVQWDLTNAYGQRIQPGAYRFMATGTDGKILSKGGFIVLE
ncbi:MAG: FG-GAP-like repeat-containing protein, partial [Bacteroidia bacterium]|nr:FG-GAP-like repeat-containing protein [Bacteroidia bacterium]